MIIVAGALPVDPDGRDADLDGSAMVVASDRDARGCRDFALSPDLLEANRINVYERGIPTRTYVAFEGQVLTAPSWPPC